MNLHKELFFTRFERLWHWGQAVLMITLMVTGFEISQAFFLLGYSEAAHIHRQVAWALIWLWAFTLFWHMITGEWRQYVPTTEKLRAVFIYYTKDIFSPQIRRHPFKKSRRFKHNPLQRIAYLVLNLIITPSIWISGLLYFYYNDWISLGLDGLTLRMVAGVHLAMAFSILIFLILHVYMTFAGTPIMAQLKAMITGYVYLDREDWNSSIECHILVVEDDDLFYGLIHSWINKPMKKNGRNTSFLPVMTELTHVTDLKQSIELLHKKAFDLIVLDLNLPDSTGDETFFSIRAQFPEIPVVILTANNDNAQIIQAMKSGVQGYLIKGEINSEILQKTIRYALERHTFQIEHQEN